MEITTSKPPRMMTDTLEAVCGKCGNIAYSERIVGVLNSDGGYDYHRKVSGGFTQKCDSEGVPTGPVIPKCNCED